ncbi:hypothetical protein NFI96_009595 [Prochilodus magdalenae]|nr:hypothetical protein NFI96_009595 [Prochilodus magdalenae]
MDDDVPLILTWDEANSGLLGDEASERPEERKHDSVTGVVEEVNEYRCVVLRVAPVMCPSFSRSSLLVFERARERRWHPARTCCVSVVGAPRPRSPTNTRTVLSRLKAG